MEHGMNCPHHADKDEACTCALTERTMHAAWRKRAEEAEARIVDLESQVNALTEDRDAQAEAVKSACRMAYRASYLGFDRSWAESQINGIQNKIVREQMQAIAAAVKGGGE